MITPLILAGGQGLRLWPLSRQTFPKQFLSLNGHNSLLQTTLGRLDAIGEYAPPVIMCHFDHRHLAEFQIREAGIVEFTLLLEPEGRNTAPAIVAAALWQQRCGHHGLMLVLPADHVIADETAFAKAVQTAEIAARHDRIVTFGITPTSPAAGYGYLRRGEAIDPQEGVFTLAGFIEKPDRNQAKKLLKGNDWHWNSGMFMFSAEIIISEIKRFKPDIHKACKNALPDTPDEVFVMLNGQAFGEAEDISIDYALMEKTDKAVIVPCDVGWSDIGDWDAVWQGSKGDHEGNRLAGDVLAIESKNSLLHSTGPMLVGLGLKNMVAIATQDAVLVAPRERTGDVKPIVEILRRRADMQTDVHDRIHRPWGYFESLNHSDGYQVKRIVVKPGAKLSLQKHRHRVEHWVVVKGRAIVTCGDERFTLNVNDATFIPRGVAHRLENPGTLPLYLIEVQIGDYLGEDDSERLEDDYGRV
jgi:mannose-1-phosphate guanylyltransferase/mannose-6-phosphate isomerase